MADSIEIIEKHGFIHEIKFHHAPYSGYSIAYHDNMPIASRDYGKLYPPLSDDDREHEMHEENLENWKADAETDLRLECEIYINNL